MAEGQEVTLPPKSGFRSWLQGNFGKLSFVLTIAGFLVSIQGLGLAVFTSYFDYKSNLSNATHGTKQLILRARVTALRIDNTPVSFLERPYPEHMAELRDFETLRYLITDRRKAFDTCLDEVTIMLRDMVAGAFPAQRGPGGAVRPPFIVFVEMVSALENQVDQSYEQNVSLVTWAFGKQDEITVQECFSQ